MNKFEITDTEGEKHRIGSSEVCRALSASSEIEKVKRLPNWSLWIFAATTFLLLALIAFAGWDYDHRKELTDDGMVTRHYFVRLLAWDLPAYKTTKISRAEYTREMIAGGDLEINQKFDTIYSVRDGKIVPGSEIRIRKDQTVNRPAQK